MATLQELIKSEIADFFAGFGSPGAPEAPEDMQSQLLSRVAPLLASMEQEPVAHIFNHPSGKLFNSLVDASNAGQPDVFPVYAAPQLPQPAVPECYQRLLKHAYGMTMGHDWNKGTMAGHHREKLCKAVEDCRAAMLQGAEPVQEWIPCSERMPVENDIVLVVDDGYFVCEAQYREGDFFSAARGKGEFFETTCRDVELWMPLPAVPQDDGK